MTRPNVVFDLSAAVHRAWHSSGGSPTDALIRLQFDIEAAAEAGELAVAVDRPDSRDGRLALFAEYKWRRYPPTSALAAFLADAVFVAKQYAPVWCAPGWEADDVVASLIDRDPFAEWVIWHCTTDEAQLIGPSVTGHWRAARERVDASWVRRRFGVPPDQLPLLQAIAGDSSDGIPGVPGYGPVKAARAVLAGWQEVVSEEHHPLVERKLRLTILRQGAKLLLC